MADKTQGQKFAQEMRRFLSIGARTRRDRKGGDLHRQIADWVLTAAMERGTLHPDQENAFRVGYEAACSWFKWIKLGRADYRVCEHISELSPYQFCGLLGDMIDADVQNTSLGGQYFAGLLEKAA